MLTLQLQSRKAVTSRGFRAVRRLGRRRLVGPAQSPNNMGLKTPTAEPNARLLGRAGTANHYTTGLAEFNSARGMSRVLCKSVS